MENYAWDSTRLLLMMQQYRSPLCVSSLGQLLTPVSHQDFQPVTVGFGGENTRAFDPPLHSLMLQ